MHGFWKQRLILWEQRCCSIAAVAGLSSVSCCWLCRRTHTSCEARCRRAPRTAQTASQTCARTMARAYRWSTTQASPPRWWPCTRSRLPRGRNACRAMVSSMLTLSAALSGASRPAALAPWRRCCSATTLTAHLILNFMYVRQRIAIDPGDCCSPAHGACCTMRG